MKEDADNGNKVSDCAEAKVAASLRSGLCCESTPYECVLISCLMLQDSFCQHCQMHLV